MKRLVLLSFIFMFSTVSAASGNFTICPSGCDYTSISGFEAGEQADLTGTGAAIATINESFVDTSNVIIIGWTTTADDYIKIMTTGDARHNGVLNNSVYILNDSIYDAALKINEDFVIIDGLQITNPHSNGLGIFVDLTDSPNPNTNIVIKNNIIYDISIDGIALGSDDYNFSIYNNILYKVGVGIVNYNYVSSGNFDWEIYSNTIVNCSTRGIYTYTQARLLANNNLVYNCTDDWSGTLKAGSSNNSYSDNSDPGGSNNLDLSSTAIEDIFQDYDNNNLNLISGSLAIDSGTTLTLFTDDVIGTSRPQGDAWDIGAFEFIVSAEDTTNPTYSNIAHNSTIASSSVNFSITWNDETALNPNGQYIFSTNNTGTWTNESTTNFTVTPQSLNVIKTLNSTVGLSIGYRWYATDNAGNSNDTGIQVLTTTSAAADTCTCPGLATNWEIDLADYCNITSNCNLSTGNLTFINNGSVLFNATLTANKISWKDSVGVIEKYDLGSIFKGWIG